MSTSHAYNLSLFNVHGCKAWRRPAKYNPYASHHEEQGRHEEEQGRHQEEEADYDQEEAEDAKAAQRRRGATVHRSRMEGLLGQDAASGAA